MKKTVLFMMLMGMVSLVVLYSCKDKDEDNVTDKTPKTNPCGTANICFEIEGKKFNFDAKWFYMQAQTKYRVSYTRDLGGVSNERIEMDWIGVRDELKAGEFDFSKSMTNPQENEGAGAFFFYQNNNGVISQVACRQGTLKILDVKNDQITATFSCQGVNHENKPVTLTAGNAYQIPRL
jgi:hypothetical protein